MLSRSSCCIRLTLKTSSCLSIRFMSKSCPKPCPRIEIKKSVCEDMTAKKQSKSNWKSIWDANCTKAPCPMPEPFDRYLYKPSDKNRKYQQTWNDCSPLVFKEKVICLYPKNIYPEPEKRPRKERVCETRKCIPEDSCKVQKKTNTKCFKITLPGCRMVRDRIDCFKPTIPSNCEKVECPELSFSECNKKNPLCKVQKECGCLHVRSITEVYCKVWAQGIMLCPVGKYCF